MSSERNRWFTTAVALAVGISAAAAVAAFIALPSLQGNAQYASVWDAICSAAGLVRPAPATAPVVVGGIKTTTVVVTPRMLDGASAISIGRGATLGLQCTMCHGARGLSEADSPNLAGQYATAIFKQLQDYKSGARSSAIMTPRVANLTEQDMRDLAAYYAYLPRLPGYHSGRAGETPLIVESGSPIRAIAPCGSCHGSVDYKVGSAWLEGQSAVYLKAQLEAFASGARHNDINQQMRNVARGMSKDEMRQAADYFASQP